MSSISVNDTHYISNYKCSYCGSVNIEYKAKEDTSIVKEVYPYLCTTCWTRMPRIYGTEFYKKI